MSRNGKVIVAMSGGVDSSVAACLLKEQGYECVGVFMRVGAKAEEETCAVEPGKAQDAALEERDFGEILAAQPRRLRHGCCSSSDALDARAIAGKLGIPFYALNFEADFAQIIDYFVGEYAVARTPNPCVMCNIHLKFGKLLRYADLMDAEFVATGHYARTMPDHRAGAQALATRGLPTTAGSNGRTCPTLLARAANLAKDQSYVLFGIARESLRRCLFPLGDVLDKSDVRRMAADLKLRVHDKPDSQEICFVPQNDYRKLIENRRPDLFSSGRFETAAGIEVGRHAGIAAYTIGQRHGLGLALGKPVYVTKLDVLSNIVTVGFKEELLSPGLIAERFNWLTDPPNIGNTLPGAIKIRHMHKAAGGVYVLRGDGRVEARFETPQEAVTPGQAVVIYDGDVVLGGGWIESSL